MTTSLDPAGRHLRPMEDFADASLGEMKSRLAAVDVEADPVDPAVRSSIRAVRTDEQEVSYGGGDDDLSKYQLPQAIMHCEEPLRNTEEEEKQASDDDEQEPLVMSNAELSTVVRTLKRKTQKLEHDLEDTRRELGGAEDEQQCQSRGWFEGSGDQKRYLSELSEDTFTFLIFSKYCRGSAFILAMILIAVQVVVFALLMASVSDRDNPDNPLGIPPNVSNTVRAGQFIALAITVITQEGMRVSLERIYDSLGKGKFKLILRSFRDDFAEVASREGRRRDQIAVTKLGLLTCIFFRFLVGGLGLVATFILIVTQSTVLDLLLDFTAVEYVSQLDDVGFGLAKQGFLGNTIQEAAEMLIERNSIVAEEAEQAADKEDQELKQDGESRTKKRRTLLGSLRRYFAGQRAALFIFVYAGLLIGWLFVVIKQQTGAFLCPTVVMEFDDAIMPELGTFSGLYDRKNGANLLDHVRYQARNQGMTWLIYCRDEQFWALTEVQSDGKPGDPCDAPVRSSSLDTFDILDLATLDWFALNSFGTPIPMQDFAVTCYTCGVEGRADNPCGGPDHGICIAKTNECQCINGWYGLNCEFPKPCETVSVDAHGDGFLGVREWSDQYNVLEDATVYHRPVYAQPAIGSSESFDVILFTGRRWVLFNRPNLDGLDSSFHPHFSVADFNVTFLSEAVDMSSSLDTGTPNGLQWYHSSKAARRGIEAADMSRDVGVTLLCSVCDISANPCLFGGTCNADGSCECLPGSAGSLCEVPPIGNARCDAFLNTPEFVFDGGDCCETTCQNSAELVCNRDDSGYFVLGNQFCQDYTNMWTQYGDAIGGLGREGTSVDLSGSGHTMAIGDPAVGIVSLVDRFGSTLVQRTVLEGSADWNFGWSVALSSGPFNAISNPDSVAPVHVAVGAPGDRTDFAQGDVPGSVYVFGCLTGRCRQKGSALSFEAFNISTTQAEDRFGYSVALSRDGNIVAVGAPVVITPESIENGAVGVFRWDETTATPTWEMMGDLLMYSSARFFGRHVILSGDGNILGISGIMPSTSTLQIVVDVRRWNDASNLWEFQGNPILSDNFSLDDLQDFFDNHQPFAMSDDGMVIALGSVFGGSYGVQVYEFDGADWTKRGPALRGVHEGDLAGWSVDLSSDGLIVVVGTGDSGVAGSSMIQIFAWSKSNGQYERLGANGVRGGRTSVALSADGRTLAARLPSLNGVEAPSAAIYTVNSPRCSSGMSHLQVSITTDLILEVTNMYGGMRWDLVVRGSGELLGAGGPYTDSLTSYLEETCVDIPEDSCVFFTFYHDSDGIQPPGGFVGFLDNTELTRNGNSTKYDRIDFGDCSCPDGESRFRIEIQTDRWPGDTTWQLVMEDSRELLLSGGPYDDDTSYVFHVHETCVPSDECLLFTIRDLFTDGLDDGLSPPGFYYGFLDNEMVFNGGGDFGFAESHFFGKCNPTPPVVDPVPCPNGSIFRLELFTDDLPSDSDWTLVDIGTGEFLSVGGPYKLVDNTRFIVEQSCVDSAVGCVEFTLFDFRENGICCGTFGDGNYSVFWDGEEVGGGAVFTASETLRVGSDCPPTMAPTTAPTIASADVTCPAGELLFRLEYWADKYPEDTTYDLVDVSTDEVLLESLPFDNARDRVRFHVDQECVNSAFDCLVFTIRDAFNDGICCANGEGNYTLFLGEQEIATGGIFADSETVRIGDACP